MGDIPTVAIINESTVAADLDLALITNALHKQVWRDFLPAFGKNGQAVNVQCIPAGRVVPVGAWQLGIFDSSDQAGALGYHDVTPQGQPLGKVFAKDDLASGSSLSVTISHELLEMLADPQITKVFSMPGPNGTTIQYAYEDCDAVEDDSLGYSINEVLLSDFVYPSWFADPASAKAGVQYDFQKKVTAPLQLLAGGYIGQQIIDANGNPQGWTQITARNAPPKPAHIIKPGSRRYKRPVHPDSRVKSRPVNTKVVHLPA